MNSLTLIVPYKFSGYRKIQKYFEKYAIFKVSIKINIISLKNENIFLFFIMKCM